MAILKPILLAALAAVAGTTQAQSNPPTQAWAATPKLKAPPTMLRPVPGQAGIHAPSLHE
ncbi:uncharacterized protein N7458_005126 [Penicillium daleae]|uniref:Uncharacterized protein n=1 Tax=Penicillium daleae TaxID=63821 RepID=A0AAD6C7P9_9EURO|nr:uncharacterized protein N7458_005126 [Penicillium daleae]KAJ5454170.1 hypothetical protein N7458_005126 [Penicillium daleae]